ncbi:branched-chain amino acid ABC transporter permease [Chloroflexota bacterium]
MISIILAYGLRLIAITGRFSIGHAGFMAVGAYTSSLLALKLDISPWFGLLAGGTVTAILALALGSVVLRISGIYFSILTMGMAQVVIAIVVWAAPWTGGWGGLVGIPGFSIAGYDFGISKAPYNYLILAITLLAVGTMYRIEKSRAGLAFQAMSQNNELAQHVGMNVNSYRILAFTVACFFAGVAGSFYVHYLHAIDPADFGVMRSFEILLYTVVGGVANPIGPALGTVFLVSAPEALRFVREYRDLSYGSILVIVVLFVPGGLVELPRRLLHFQSGIRARFIGTT